ncbi:hypothetical protein CG51_13115 [Haematobacter missouriensis]|uniref:Uncharacterized protein n=1 Tax=Haematobacter missouriensis TaxID=366616 RepID=A0A212ATW8_9RHOB|nr:hypothetical protein [Haematobacter missouriensis]KFI33511.1 hypothetical protein CG51_13115 [Haematobacter missouriensis]OWJ75744.1 hypothetical protein CDV53_09395 [Haematobacter missouriensis]OWJ84933.1 hypothetical protein CDV52_05565 [Haematobacter missouriensis]
MRLSPLFRPLIIALSLALAGCAPQLALYDAGTVDRAADLATLTIGIYQDLLILPPSERAAAVERLRPRYAEVETRLRVQLLREESRVANATSAVAARELLILWQKASAGQLRGDPAALSSATLLTYRDRIERLFRTLLSAEESKRLLALVPLVE